MTATSLRERLEAARTRQRRAGAAREPGPACNLLLLSDTHLGEFIKEHARIEFLKRAAEIDRDLCDFLDYYASRTVDGKPWRLIINGDFLDFLTVTVMPSARVGTKASELDPEEEVYGLDTSEDKVVWKLERIVERHQVLFAYLADFVGRGNYVDMLYGNHDSEFFWPKAKAAFVRHLTNVFFGTEKIPGKTEEAFSSRIRWHEWFLYEPGRFYVEHGNQYDDFSSFEYRLAPVLPYKPTSVAMPASHQVIRYFVNRIRGFQTHNKDNWGLWDFLRWTFRQGRQALLLIISSYFDLTRRLIHYARTLKNADDHEVAAQHRERLADEAERYGLEVETLQRIDALHNGPIHNRLGSLLQAAAIDRWGLIVFYFVTFIIAVASSGWATKLTLLTGWALLLWGRRHVLRLIRHLFMGGEISTLVAPKLDRAAEQIAELLDVRYVAFGHSHRPVLRQIRDDPPCWYINTGCWLVSRQGDRPSLHRSPLTFCRILDRSRPEATLFSWSWRGHKPEMVLSQSRQLEPEVEVERQIRSARQLIGDRTGGPPRGPRRGQRTEGVGEAAPRQRTSLRKQRY
jgi:UDP-2,3-diacylglucosamine pyrophosphatase LpxH